MQHNVILSKPWNAGSNLAIQSWIKHDFTQKRGGRKRKGKMPHVRFRFLKKIERYLNPTLVCINIEAACYESDLNQRDGWQEGRRLYCLDFCLPLLACLSSVQTSRWRINSSLDTLLLWCGQISLFLPHTHTHEKLFQNFFLSLLVCSVLPPVGR